MFMLKQLFIDAVEFLCLIPENSYLIIQRVDAKEDDTEHFKIMRDSDWNLDPIVTCIYYSKDGSHQVFFQLPIEKSKELRRLGIHLTDMDWDFSRDDKEFIKSALEKLSVRFSKY